MSVELVDWLPYIPNGELTVDVFLLHLHSDVRPLPCKIAATNGTIEVGSPRGQSLEQSAGRTRFEVG